MPTRGYGQALPLHTKKRCGVRPLEAPAPAVVAQEHVEHCELPHAGLAAWNADRCSSLTHIAVTPAIPAQMPQCHLLRAAPNPLLPVEYPPKCHVALAAGPRAANDGEFAAVVQCCRVWLGTAGAP